MTVINIDQHTYAIVITPSWKDNCGYDIWKIDNMYRVSNEFKYKSTSVLSRVPFSGYATPK